MIVRTRYLRPMRLCRTVAAASRDSVVSPECTGLTELESAPLVYTEKSSGGRAAASERIRFLWLTEERTDPARQCACSASAAQQKNGRTTCGGSRQKTQTSGQFWAHSSRTA